MTSTNSAQGKPRRLLGELPLETAEIPQALLNIENKDRSNLLPWSGQFSPQFVEALLTAYAPPQAVILDPFAGSGTVLYEAARRHLHAVGAELNPAAYLLSSVYRLINVETRERNQLLARLDELIERAFPDSLPLFAPCTNDQTADECKSVLTVLARAADDPFVRLLLQALIIRLDFYQDGLSREKIRTMWHRLRALVLHLPFSPNRLDIFHCDARVIPITGKVVDLVVSSPPYINVFNYHQQYRASAEALGWDLLAIAKSEIGSNRKHRGNRFLTVIQYCLDLAQVFARLSATLKPTGRVVFVLGRESRVRGVPFHNGEIAALLGTRCGSFQLKTRQERVFKNRFGASIYEDILHFTEPPGTCRDPLPEARRIAGEMLNEAKKSAPREVISDLEAAAERLGEIEPSPCYQNQATSRSKETPHDSAQFSYATS
ncbi:MAG: DNA methyltransferase [Blastocatellia bacterium]